MYHLSSQDLADFIVTAMNEEAHNIVEAEVDPRVDLAILRTELAWERTLLAWIRTSIALMGAGVAFDKGAQLLHQARLSAGTAFVRNGHIIGFTIICLSILLLSAVTLQYLQSLRQLARIRTAKVARVRPAVIGSVLVVLLGIAGVVVLAMSGG